VGLSQHLSGEAEDNYEKPQLAWLVPPIRVAPQASRQKKNEIGLFRHKRVIMRAFFPEGTRA
jgi:hypothetical protein